MKKLLFVMSILFPIACVSANKQLSNWETDELFTQLSELRKEVNKIKAEVDSLKANVTKLENSKNAIKKSDVIGIGLNDSFVLGSNDAQYAIIEFTDYQCPYCLKHSVKTLPKIKQSFIDSGKVKYLIKDYPLAFHGQARNAAISARCAGQQGKYWEMHDLIFANNKQLTENIFASFAVQLNIDVAIFETCLVDPDVIEIIDENIVEAEAAGVHGTPAFFIGKVKGNRLVETKALFGAQSFSIFSKILGNLIQRGD